MRLAILGVKSKTPYFMKFGEELNRQGVKTIVVEASEYTTLNSKVPQLRVVPFPKGVSLLHDVDAVYVDDPYYAVWLARFQRKKSFVHLRGHIWSENYWQKTLSSNLPEKILLMWKFFVRIKGLQFADVLLPICDWLTKETAIRFPNKRTYTLYHGIDCKTWMEDIGERMELKHPAVITLFDFRIYPKVKGLLSFINEIKDLNSVHFYIAGDGPYNPKNVGVENIHFLGNLRYPDEVKRFCYSGDLYVHPSGQDMCPKALLEASLCELPILTSSVGGIPEIVKHGETGRVVKNLGEWKREILYYLGNRGDAKRLGRNARIFVKDHFDWEKIARRFTQILESELLK